MTGATTRRMAAVVRTTAAELLGEPFVFLTLLASLALTVLAPAFHYHQFGEVTRMARDAGFSAALLGGALAGVFGTIRSIRREIEGGTCEAALAHAISPGAFLLAKALGAAVALALFLASVFALAAVMVNGTEIGGAVAARTGGLARPWGPSLAVGVAVLILPVLAAALLNRFARARFTRTASLLTFVLSLAGLLLRPDLRMLLRYLPAALLVSVPVFLLTGAAAAFAFRFRAHVAAALTGLVAAATLPALGNYCIPEALARGGHVPGSYLAWAALAAVPALAAVVSLGALQSSRGESE